MILNLNIDDNLILRRDYENDCKLLTALAIKLLQSHDDYRIDVFINQDREIVFNHYYNEDVPKPFVCVAIPDSNFNYSCHS